MKCKTDELSRMVVEEKRLTENMIVWQAERDALLRKERDNDVAFKQMQEKCDALAVEKQVLIQRSSKKSRKAVFGGYN